MDDPIEIARRKERLIARCAAQRESLAVAVRELRQPIAVLDRAWSAALFLRAHPVLVGAAVAAAVALRRRNLFALAMRGFALWRMWRRISSWAQGPIGYWRGNRSHKH
jgi:hypothetical protein